MADKNKLLTFCVLFWVVVATTGQTAKVITKANSSQIKDITELIKMINFDYAPSQGNAGTLKTYTGKSGMYRLDMQGYTTAQGSNPRLTRYMIQSGTLTYGSVQLLPEKMFGRDAIKEAFSKSVHMADLVVLK